MCVRSLAFLGGGAAYWLTGSLARTLALVRRISSYFETTSCLDERPTSASLWASHVVCRDFNLDSNLLDRKTVVPVPV